MLLLFFAVWIVFNGRLTAEIAVFGAVIAVLMFAFVCRFMGYSVKKECALYGKLPLYGRYGLLLLREIVNASPGDRFALIAFAGNAFLPCRHQK